VSAARGWEEARPEVHWFDPFFVTMVTPALAWLGDAGDRAPRLLHLGCGLGAKTETLRRLGYDAVGVDVDDALVARARVSFPRPHFVTADAQRLPFGDGSFDVVFSFSTLQLVDDREQALREAARVLRPGGRAIFIENLEGSPLARGYRALHAALGLRYARFQAPKKHVAHGDMGAFARHFAGVETTVFHLTTPLTLVVPSLMTTLARRPMRVQYPAAYRALARLDARVLGALPRARRFGWHVVATMTRREA
jgi:SAM-dependent methyltransferase